MDPGPPPGCSLKDVKWSAVAVPLDRLVSTYRLPQIARLDSEGDVPEPVKCTPSGSSHDEDVKCPAIAARAVGSGGVRNPVWDYSVCMPRQELM
ncbi:hypothetical protein BTVI_145594 [Pitangus sulphuratus]|nr:hypothetical protein BTVI_145594 [Pitangus sulphuratus]